MIEKMFALDLSQVSSVLKQNDLPLEELRTLTGLVCDFDLFLEEDNIERLIEDRLLANIDRVVYSLMLTDIEDNFINTLKKSLFTYTSLIIPILKDFIESYIRINRDWFNGLPKRLYLSPQLGINDIGLNNLFLFKITLNEEPNLYTL